MNYYHKKTFNINKSTDFCHLFEVFKEKREDNLMQQNVLVKSNCPKTSEMPIGLGEDTLLP